MRIRLDFKFSIHYYTAFPLVSTLYFFNEMLLVPLIKLLCTQWTERCQSPYKPLLKHVTSREAHCIDWEGPWQTLYNFYLVPFCPSIEWNGAGEESGTGAWAPLRSLPEVLDRTLFAVWRGFHELWKWLYTNDSERPTSTWVERCFLNYPISVSSRAISCGVV